MRLKVLKLVDTSNAATEVDFREHLALLLTALGNPKAYGSISKIN